MNFVNRPCGMVPLAALLMVACSDSSPTDTGNRDSIRPVVSAVTPAASATGVAIGATITVTFSEPVDPASVTAGTFTITGPAGAVTGSVTVAGAVATFTPSAPLTELATTYAARVTTGVRDLAGNTLAAEHSWSFVTEFVSPLYWYRLSNKLLGDDRALDTYNDPANRCFMNTTGPFTGQRWFFTPGALPGTYRLNNMFRGPSLSLESGDGSAACGLDPSGLFSGQHWTFVPVQSDPGYYRLQSVFRGTGQSLDVTPGDYVPLMAVTGQSDGQLWRVRRGGTI